VREVKALPPKPGLNTFHVDITPNSELAVNNKYVEHIIPSVEVLKNWKVRYRAHAGGGMVKWHVDGKEIGEGASFEETKGTLGVFQVAMTDKDGLLLGAIRTVTVGDVVSVNFSLTPVGEYRKLPTIPDWVVPPNTNLFGVPQEAIQFQGRVNLALGSPPLTRFSWSYIQSVESNPDVKFHPYNITPAGLEGTFVKAPPFFSSPTVPKNTNDTETPGLQLYTTGVGLGANRTSDDTPGITGPIFRHDALTNAKKAVDVIYALATPNSYDLKFTLWQVVYHAETFQYVPLKQCDWTLSWHTKDPGPWKAKLGDKGIEEANSRPPDSTTSSSKYRDSISARDPKTEKEILVDLPYPFKK